MGDGFCVEILCIDPGKSSLMMTRYHFGVHPRIVSGNSGLQSAGVAL